MVATGYLAVKTGEDSIEDGDWTRPTFRPQHHTAFVPGLCFALLASLALNGLFYSNLLKTTAVPHRDGTRVAGLTWDTPSVIEYSSPFNNPNRTLEDEAWSSSLVDPASLVVAVDDSFTESLGVSHSLRWPWSSQKGVYTLNSAHELHCLHLLRKAINEAYDGDELTWPRGHSVHCLEYLLQNVMCYADDTLLYQGLLHQNKDAAVPIGGLGDTRTCRSWSKLQAWAKDNSACYNPYIEEGDPTFPEIDRYKFCPNGDRPWETT